MKGKKLPDSETCKCHRGNNESQQRKERSRERDNKSEKKIWRNKARSDNTGRKEWNNHKRKFGKTSDIQEKNLKIGSLKKRNTELQLEIKNLKEVNKRTEVRKIKKDDMITKLKVDLDEKVNARDKKIEAQSEDIVHLKKTNEANEL